MALTSLILPGMGYGDGDGHMWDDGWMWLWGSLMMLFWAAVLIVIVWLIIRATRRDDVRPGFRAEEILAERFARGELTADEYRERRDALR